RLSVPPPWPRDIGTERPLGAPGRATCSTPPATPAAPAPPDAPVTQPTQTVPAVVPQTSVPQTSTPQTSVPQTATPQSSAPVAPASAAAAPLAPQAPAPPRAAAVPRTQTPAADIPAFERAPELPPALEIRPLPGPGDRRALPQRSQQQQRTRPTAVPGFQGRVRPPLDLSVGAQN